MSLCFIPSFYEWYKLTQIDNYKNINFSSLKHIFHFQILR